MIDNELQLRYNNLESAYNLELTKNKLIRDQRALLEDELDLVRKEKKELQAILENKLIGEKEGNTLAASYAYYEIAKILEVEEGHSVIETVEKLLKQRKDLIDSVNKLNNIINRGLR